MLVYSVMMSLARATVAIRYWQHPLLNTAGKNTPIQQAVLVIGWHELKIDPKRLCWRRKWCYFLKVANLRADPHKERIS